MVSSMSNKTSFDPQEWQSLIRVPRLVAEAMLDRLVEDSFSQGQFEEDVATILSTAHRREASSDLVRSAAREASDDRRTDWAVYQTAWPDPRQAAIGACHTAAAVLASRAAPAERMAYVRWVLAIAASVRSVVEESQSVIPPEGADPQALIDELARVLLRGQRGGRVSGTVNRIRNTESRAGRFGLIFVGFIIAFVAIAAEPWLLPLTMLGGGGWWFKRRLSGDPGARRGGPMALAAMALLTTCGLCGLITSLTDTSTTPPDRAESPAEDDAKSGRSGDAESDSEKDVEGDAEGDEGHGDANSGDDSSAGNSTDRDSNPAAPLLNQSGIVGTEDDAAGTAQEATATAPEPTATAVPPTTTPVPPTQAPPIDRDPNGARACDDFPSYEIMQRWRTYWIARGIGNPGGLDGDGDGVACEDGEGGRQAAAPTDPPPPPPPPASIPGGGDGGGGAGGGSGCCRVCTPGVSKPCGNTCISVRFNCHTEPGCACGG